eukprot:1150229-Pelagomonas_calceolata.AAC.7
MDHPIAGLPGSGRRCGPGPRTDRGLAAGGQTQSRQRACSWGASEVPEIDWFCTEQHINCCRADMRFGAVEPWMCLETNNLCLGGWMQRAKRGLAAGEAKACLARSVRCGAYMYTGWTEDLLRESHRRASLQRFLCINPVEG